MSNTLSREQLYKQLHDNKLQLNTRRWTLKNNELLLRKHKSPTTIEETQAYITYKARVAKEAQEVADLQEREQQLYNQLALLQKGRIANDYNKLQTLSDMQVRLDALQSDIDNMGSRFRNLPEAKREQRRLDEIHKINADIADWRMKYDTLLQILMLRWTLPEIVEYLQHLQAHIAELRAESEMYYQECQRIEQLHPALPVFRDEELSSEEREHSRMWRAAETNRVYMDKEAYSCEKSKAALLNLFIALITQKQNDNLIENLFLESLGNAIIAPPSKNATQPLN